MCLVYLTHTIDMFCLLFKDISMAHADEEERTVTECGQGKIQKHKYTSLKGNHSLTRAEGYP